MRTVRILLTFGILTTAALAQDALKPSAALKDDAAPVAAPTTLAAAPAAVPAADTTTGTATAAPVTTPAPAVMDSTDLLIDRIIGREHFMMESMSHLSPML